LQNELRCACDRCGADNRFAIAEDAPEHDIVHCAACGHAMASVGQLHARIAQQALGLGATELRDDHVPVEGEPGERPNR
jgi:Zn ribbon nucleic-acid-binding protein